MLSVHQKKLHGFTPLLEQNRLLGTAPVILANALQIFKPWYYHYSGIGSV